MNTAVAHAKQELGWADYRVTDSPSIERWWELVFCASTLLSFPCPAVQTTKPESEPEDAHKATPVDQFVDASLVGSRSGVEEHLEYLATGPPAVCLLLFAFALAPGLRYPVLTYWLCCTHWNHECGPCYHPDLTEQG